MDKFLMQYYEPIRNMFLILGIKNVTMDNICSELGISKRTLYEKFDTKSQLVNEIFQQDFYEFKNKLTSVNMGTNNAVYESYLLFKIISEKQKTISTTVFLDLKRFHNHFFNRTSVLINQVIFAQLLAIIRHGVIDGDFREDSEASDIADIIVFIFNSIYTTAVYNTGITLASISFENLLNYHLHSICTLQGLKRWEEIKEQLR